MKKVFGSLSISNKLGVVFILLLCMMGIGGLVGLYNAKQLANITKSLYTDSFKRGETLVSIENEFLSARHEVFLHTVISDTASKYYLVSSLEEHHKKINRLLGEFNEMGPAQGQSALYGELAKNLDRYWNINTKILALSDKGDREAALSIIRTAGNESFTATLNTIKKLAAREKEYAFTTYQKSKFFASIIIIITIAFTLAAIVVAAGLWLILTRALVKPLLSLEESARKIGQGRLTHRAPVVTEDEIGNLATEFNKMAANLENYYATMEKKVEERTEELRAANEELFRKKQELEFANMELLEANTMKSQFLANVSHELRTPLNSIIGFSELLLERAFGDLNERQLQYVEFVHSSGGHLLQLINNILDLSKIEAGRMGLIMEEFPILEVVGEILGIIKPLAHQKNIQIDSKTVPASPMIRADKVKFKQILINLLSNAVKFNKDGGAIKVDWEIAQEPSGMKMERYFIFKVTDTGIGIRKDDMSKLFKEFEQIDSSFTREYGGTGLGLALTKRLVELHKGSVWVESEPGKGSTFFVKLPKGTEDLDMPVLTNTVYMPSPDETRPTVLIASESPDINRLLEIYLSGSYDVTTAQDGLELLRKAREQMPFAIIMGIALPKKDGWEALKELKASSETSKIPVIIISSIDNQDLGYTLGASDWLEKPVSKEKLMSVLGRLREKTPKKSRLRVMLAVEDYEGLKDAAGFLEAEGFTVFKAKTGDEALKVAKESNPDVIVLRMKIDGTTGPDFFRALDQASNAKKIIITHDDLPPEEKRQLGAGYRIIHQKDGLINETLLSEIKLSEAF